MRISQSVAFSLSSLALANAFTTSKPYVSRANINHKLHLSKNSDNEFDNDGLFSWMQPYLRIGGFGEGKTTFYGPAVKVDPSDFPSEQEQQKRRRLAEQELFNINVNERERRRNVGQIMYKVSIAYAFISALFLDQGDFSGQLARFGIILPLFFAIGYTKSADSGLWNIAQEGLWDVDGTGMRRIEDENLARSFLRRVNEMNVDTGKEIFVIAGAFAVLPHDLAARLASVIFILGALYFLEGKIPRSA